MKGEGISQTDDKKELLAGFSIQRVYSRGDTRTSAAVESCALQATTAVSRRAESFTDQDRRASFVGAVKSALTAAFQSPTVFVPLLVDARKASSKDRKVQTGGAPTSSILLICPGMRPAVHALARSAPLALAP